MHDAKHFKDLEAKFYEEERSTSFPMVSSQQVLKACFHPLYRYDQKATYVLKIDKLSLPKGGEMYNLEEKPNEEVKMAPVKYSINGGEDEGTEDNQSQSALSLGQQ